jgi:hypothetical protein
MWEVATHDWSSCESGVRTLYKGEKHGPENDIGGDKDRQLKQLWTETRIGNILPWDEIADEAERLLESDQANRQAPDDDHVDKEQEDDQVVDRDETDLYNEVIFGRKRPDSVSVDWTSSGVPATVREQNHNRKLTSLKKKIAQMSSVRNKQKRESLLQQVNALLADMTEAPAKKSKKKIKEEEPEVGLAELTDNAPPTGGLSIHVHKPNPKKKAQVDELDRMLAGSTLCRQLGTVTLFPVTIFPTPECHLIS